MELPVRFVLVDPPPDVAFGIQRGKGARFESVLVQRRMRGDITFDFSLTLADGRSNARPRFQGPFAQGTPDDRFVYIGVGTFAGEKDSPWSRRMKIPLRGISATLVREVTARPGRTLQVRIPGKGRDGTPNCATVTVTGPWTVVPGGGSRRGV